MISDSVNVFTSIYMQESLEVFLAKSKNKDQRVSIIGKIFMIEKLIADSPTNAYNIPVGTEYYICYAEPVFKQSLTSGNSSNKFSSSTAGAASL